MSYDDNPMVESTEKQPNDQGCAHRQAQNRHASTTGFRMTRNNMMRRVMKVAIILCIVLRRVVGGLVVGSSSLLALRWVMALVLVTVFMSPWSRRLCRAVL